MKSLYLTIDLLTIALPLLFSFHTKIGFYKKWRAIIIAIVCVAVPFLLLDSIFTSYGVWNFNPLYITGLSLFNLPVEEILFFICIPYACVFTYFCLNKFYDFSWNPTTESIFCVLFSTFLMITGFIFRQKIYTSSTFISTGILCLFLKFGLHITWFGNAVSVFSILLLPFLLVNGILTGTGLPAPIVGYNPSYNLGIRLITIPVEDFIYGFELFLFNLLLFVRFSKQATLSHSFGATETHKSASMNNNRNQRAV